MINNRLNKIESNMFADSQIDDICRARFLYRRLTRRSDYSGDLSEAEAIEAVKGYFPHVPPSLLPANITGKLMQAEKRFAATLPLIPDTESAAILFHRLVETMDTETALRQTKTTFPVAMREFADAARDVAKECNVSIGEVLDVMISKCRMPAEFLLEVMQCLEPKNFD